MTNPRNIREEEEVWVEFGEVVANANEATKQGAAFAGTNNWDGNTFVI